MISTDQKALVEWATETFAAGCYLGDLAREAQQDGYDMSEDEEMNLICAREGWLAK